MSKRGLFWLLASLITAMMCWLAFSAICESGLIVWLGVKLFTALRLAAAIMLMICIALIIGWLIRIKVARVREEESQAQQAAEERQREMGVSYANENLTPDSIKKHLVRLYERNPALRGVIDRGFEQMEKMDSYQARLHRLLNVNEAEYLRSTESVLDDVEIYLCKNLRNVINFCITAGGDDGNARLSERGQTAAERNFAENDQTLQTVQEFLDYATNLVNDRNNNSGTGQGDFKVLEHWIETIRASLKEVANET